MATSFAFAAKNFSRIPIEPPYVRTVLNDYLYNGYIGVISLEAIRKLLVKEGDIEVTNMDFTFDFAIFLNVS